MNIFLIIFIISFSVLIGILFLRSSYNDRKELLDKMLKEKDIDKKTYDKYVKIFL